MAVESPLHHAPPRRRTEPPSTFTLPGPRWAWLWALGIVGGVIAFYLHKGNVTDDSYAFLDWGRDLRHHYLPLLGGRAFQPLPIAAGAGLSLFGGSSPDITMMFTLGTLVIMAAGAWRIMELLDIPQPAPLVAAFLAGFVMPSFYVADVAYNNGPYATLMIWALVLDMEKKYRGAWLLLMIDGLMRPEAWPFLCAYGVLTWWREGHTLDLRKLLRIAVLVAAPIVAWLVMEWIVAGKPLYSEESASGSAVSQTGTGTYAGIFDTIHLQLSWEIVFGAFVGAGSAFFFPRRNRVLLLVATTLLTLIGLLILAHSHFNVPGRDYSLLSPLMALLAVVGFSIPARLVRRHKQPFAAVFAVGALCLFPLVYFTVPHTMNRLGPTMKYVAFGRYIEQSFNHEIGSVAHDVDIKGAKWHSVAMVGAVDDSELAWVLGVPYTTVIDQIEGSRTHLIVEPTELTIRELDAHKLDNRTRERIPAGWRLLLNGKHWQVYAPPEPLPIKLY
ncbi:MAG TPA: hypothetical protein VMA83_12310 [Solirubrobacteraceae bacterium]|nr:hypothetical protein [Solirubrobacteraceae bacterium]